MSQRKPGLPVLQKRQEGEGRLIGKKAEIKEISLEGDKL